MRTAPANRGDLESPICDISLMASVTCTVMEGFLKNLAASRGMTGANTEKLVISIEADFEDLTFCIYHLSTMAKALNRLYQTEAVAS